MKNILEHVVKRVFRFTYGRDPIGDGPRIRKKFSYFTPEDYYQASVVACLKKSDKWLDIGCGRNIFPSNARLTKVLTSRAKEAVGVDPSPNVLENTFLDRAYQGYADSVKEENYYDLVTLRMVAEHVADPAALVNQIDRVSANGAHVIIYTIYACNYIYHIQMVAGIHNHQVDAFLDTSCTQALFLEYGRARHFPC